MVQARVHVKIKTINKKYLGNFYIAGMSGTSHSNMDASKMVHSI
jgi:hypothetical protein